MDWLQRLLQRKPNSKAPAVKEAEKVQTEKFDDWANVMREVDRVQKIAQHEHRSHRATRQ